MSDRADSTSGRVLIDDPVELRALVRALQVALRCRDADDTSVVGSAIVAGMAHRAVDALMALDQDDPKALGRWQAWRQAHNHPDLPSRLRHLIEGTTGWADMSVSTQRGLIEAWSAPLRIDDAFIERLLGPRPGADLEDMVTARGKTAASTGDGGGC